MSTDRKCIAIAFRWVFTPPNVGSDDSLTAYDLALIMSKCSGKIVGEEISADKTASVETVVFHAKLPQKEQALRLSDVSGTLGLVYPTTGHHLTRRANAAERLIADAIMWTLADEQFLSPSQGGQETMILLQGPLLPKLRGRFLYRSAAEHVKIFCITYHAEWLQSLEAAPRMINSLGESDVSDVYPPPGIDKSTRSWVVRHTDGDETRHYYHLETLLDPHYCCERTDWLDIAKRDVTLIKNNCGFKLPEETFPFRFASSTPLPAPLARATRDARMRKNAELYFARLLPTFKTRTSASDLFSTREGAVFVKFLDPGFQARHSPQREFDILNAASNPPVSWDDPKDVYANLKRADLNNLAPLS